MIALRVAPNLVAEAKKMAKGQSNVIHLQSQIGQWIIHYNKRDIMEKIRTMLDDTIQRLAQLLDTQTTTICLDANDRPVFEKTAVVDERTINLIPIVIGLGGHRIKKIAQDATFNLEQLLLVPKGTLDPKKIIHISFNQDEDPVSCEVRAPRPIINEVCDQVCRLAYEIEADPLIDLRKKSETPQVAEEETINLPSNQQELMEAFPTVNETRLAAAQKQKEAVRQHFKLLNKAKKDARTQFRTRIENTRAEGTFAVLQLLGDDDLM